MTFSIRIAAVVFVLALHASAQNPAPAGEDRVVGSVSGKPVTERDLAAFLARAYWATPAGRSLVEDLRDRAIVSAAVSRHGITVTDEQVKAAYDRLDARVKKETGGKQSLADYIRSKRTTQAEFVVYLRRLESLRAVLRKERGLGADAKVSDAEVNSWLANARKSAPPVVSDPAKLPAGTILQIGDRAYADVEFGGMLLKSLSAKDRARELDRLLKIRVIESALAEKKLTIGAADLDRAIDRERRRYKNNPQTRSVPYESILRQLGTTVEEKKRNPSFRANVGIMKIARATFDRATLEKYYADNQDRLGESVRVRHILVRTRKQGQTFGRGLDDKVALERIQKALEKIRAGADFAKVARVASDDSSKFRGGDIGYVYRVGKFDPALRDRGLRAEEGRGLRAGSHRPRLPSAPGHGAPSGRPLRQGRGTHLARACAGLVPESPRLGKVREPLRTIDERQHKPEKATTPQAVAAVTCSPRAPVLGPYPTRAAKKAFAKGPPRRRLIRESGEPSAFGCAWAYLVGSVSRTTPLEQRHPYRVGHGANPPRHARVEHHAGEVDRHPRQLVAPAAVDLHPTGDISLVAGVPLEVEEDRRQLSSRRQPQQRAGRQVDQVTAAHRNPGRDPQGCTDVVLLPGEVGTEPQTQGVLERLRAPDGQQVVAVTLEDHRRRRARDGHRVRDDR